MKIVIAGNRAQFENYCKTALKCQGPDVKFVSRPEDVMGMEIAEEDIILVGEYWRNPIYESDALKAQIRRR